MTNTRNLPINLLCLSLDFLHGSFNSDLLASWVFVPVLNLEHQNLLISFVGLRNSFQNSWGISLLQIVQKPKVRVLQTVKVRGIKLREKFWKLFQSLLDRMSYVARWVQMFSKVWLQDEFNILEVWMVFIEEVTCHQTASKGRKINHSYVRCQFNWVICFTLRNPTLAQWSID